MVSDEFMLWCCFVLILFLFIHEDFFALASDIVNGFLNGASSSVGDFQLKMQVHLGCISIVGRGYNNT